MEVGGRLISLVNHTKLSSSHSKHSYDCVHLITSANLQSKIKCLPSVFPALLSFAPLRACYLVLIGLYLVAILLPLTSEHWDYRHAQPCH